MSNTDDLATRARSLHDEGLLSDAGLERFVAALKTDEGTPAEYAAFLDHIETRRDAPADGTPSSPAT